MATNENLVANVYYGGTKRASATLTVNDTTGPLTITTYLESDLENIEVNVGTGSKLFGLVTGNVPNGTVVDIRFGAVAGVTIEGGGVVTMQNGSARFVIKPKLVNAVSKSDRLASIVWAYVNNVAVGVAPLLFIWRNPAVSISGSGSINNQTYTLYPYGTYYFRIISEGRSNLQNSNTGYIKVARDISSYKFVYTQCRNYITYAGAVGANSELFVAVGGSAADENQAGNRMPAGIVQRMFKLGNLPTNPAAYSFGYEGYSYERDSRYSGGYLRYLVDNSINRFIDQPKLLAYQLAGSPGEGSTNGVGGSYGVMVLTNRSTETAVSTVLLPGEFNRNGSFDILEINSAILLGEVQQIW